MNSLQQAIILTSVIGTILKEYDDGEGGSVVPEMRTRCMRFMKHQSGMRILPFGGARIIDKRRNDQFLRMVKIGDAIWKKTVDKYAGNGITVEASAFIMAVYDFAPDALNRHVTLSPKLISKLIDQNTDIHAQSSHNGTVVGGYITELLYEELGLKINGRLRALKNKIARTL